MSNNIKALLVDDLVQARKLLRLMLCELAPDVTVVAEAANVVDAVEQIKAHAPDVIFLDIEMPGKSGLYLAEWLISENINSHVIFTTAYNEYAIKAFRLAAVDYLLKPIDEQQLSEAVARIKEKVYVDASLKTLKVALSNIEQKGNAQTLSIPTLNGYLFLDVANIMYIKADGAYTHICIKDKPCITVSKNLKYFETALLDIVGFVRVHRSYLVNTRYVKRFDKADRGSLLMADDVTIDVARDRRDALFTVLDI